jgi:putative hydrolase of the HAD superfamily
MKVCLFDCGGVIYPYSLKPFNDWIQEKTGTNKPSFLWKELMKGDVSFSTFCKDVCDKTGQEYLPETEKKIHTLLCAGVGKIYPQTIELMSYLKKKNVKIGLVSNALPHLDAALKDLPFDLEFMFPSYQMDALKPDEKIFKAVLKKINEKPEDILFIDDKKENVKAAESFGIKGIVFEKETVLKSVQKMMGENDVRYIGYRRCHCR